MKAIFKEFELKGFKIKNRIVMPPMVNFGWSDDNGFVNEKHIKHYEERARANVGTIIVEATAIKKEGRGFIPQLGIWDDSQIEGMKKITDACHKYGSVMLLQLHHGGFYTPETVSEKAAGPSIDPKISRSYSLATEEIKELTNDFINGAVRAKKAGFDGIEIHGAHLYLLCLFASAAINKRTDEYGGRVSKRLKFAGDIIKGIKNNSGNDFIICYRMGANAPTLDDGIQVAQELEKLGVDILNVSHGGVNKLIPQVPENFGYNWIVYSGTEIKKHITIPVIVVNEIKTPERASYLIENNLTDFVAIGRDLLTDPQWVEKACRNEKVNQCISCKPKCKRYESEELCPAKKLLG
ncbi:MAG: NADH:flavin oxidoreductase [Bacteroidales bacterium]|jgi:2,4-dienoyl-CoA reductase-like NADH-dependent reductase (Old Yellow Enzyme family)